MPYRGGAPLIQDMLANQIDMVLGDPPPHPGAQRQHQSLMRWRSKTAGAGAPDVPTMDEAGVPGLHASFWHGLWAPKGTPKEIIARLNAAMMADSPDPAVQRRFATSARIPPRHNRHRGLAPRKKRDRKVVADHQGGQHQGGVTLKQGGVR